MAQAAASTSSYAQQLPHLQIVDRFVEQFPLVNSTFNFANARFSQLKGSSPLVTATLDRAESLGFVVAQAMVTVVKKLKNPIHYVDNQAVRGFDLIQGKVGELQKSSGELRDSTLKVLDQTKERIRVVKTQTLSTVNSKLHWVLVVPADGEPTQAPAPANPTPTVTGVPTEPNIPEADPAIGEAALPVGARLSVREVLDRALRAMRMHVIREVLDGIYAAQAARQARRLEAGRPEAGRPEAGRPEAGRPEAGRPEAAAQAEGWECVIQ